MKTSEEINEIAKALSQAQQQMKPAIKDSTNPHFKSKYSDISSVWEAIREPLTNCSLSVLQDVTTKIEEKLILVTTRIFHASGQWIEFGPLGVPLSKCDAHGVGSAISYGKRYALCAAVGVVSGDEDDDGNHAVSKPSPKLPERTIQHEEYITNNPDKYEYVKLISKESKRSEIDVLNQVFANTQRFDEAFEKWKNKPRSMDEVV